MPSLPNPVIGIYFSDVFGVSPEVVEDYGAFNVSLVNDLPLFIDPFLLFNSEKDEYRQLHDEIIAYVRFLRDMAQDGKLDPGLLKAWYYFPEVKQNWFGYSNTGNRGSGLGSSFAQSLHRNLNTLFTSFGDETITRGSHLEKLCLVRDKVGRDNISDFTTNLIKGYLCRYNEAFARTYVESSMRRKVAVEKVSFNYNTRTWQSQVFELPFVDGDYVLLTPKDMLTKDDTWINQRDLVEDFADIAKSIPNAQLRAQVDQYFLRVLPKRPKSKERREAVARVIAKFPAFIDHFIRYKEDTGERAASVSRERVSEVQAAFVTAVQEFALVLARETGFFTTSRDTYAESMARVEYLKQVIEHNGGYRVFYIKHKPVKRESDLQLMFRLVWYGSLSDVSSEVDDGRGPVDYKISRGGADKTLVEFKLASNSKLEQNLAHQVPVYLKASQTNKSIKVILYFSAAELRKVHKVLKNLKLTDAENVVLIDARQDNKLSGSRARFH